MKYKFIGKNISKHQAESEAEKLASLLYEKCHGSGLNYDFEFYQKGNILRLNTWYDVMNDVGYYDCATPIEVWFNISKKELVNIRCKNTGKYFEIKDFLEDVFYNSIEEVGKRV